MSGIRPMAKEEGAALRIQLGAMLAALRADDPAARREMDADTIELIARLQGAHDVAVKIEDTHASLAARKGVRLAKVTTLAARA